MSLSFDYSFSLIFTTFIIYHSHFILFPFTLIFALFQHGISSFTTSTSSYSSFTLIFCPLTTYLKLYNSLLPPLLIPLLLSFFVFLQPKTSSFTTYTSSNSSFTLIFCLLSAKELHHLPLLPSYSSFTLIFCLLSSTSSN